MAEVVKRKLRTTYPWKEWIDATLDKEDTVVEATQGVDFDVELESFRVNVHQIAFRRGLRAVTKIIGSTVIFRFETKSEE